MRMMSLALMNFKNSFRNYLSLVISLSFTILIFFNFQNIIYSDGLAVLGAKNKEYTEMVVQVISFVLVCFMFFFIWYSTNVFLTKRKKEIGIYVFMGLSNQKIGRLYAIETALTGVSALIFGIFSGVLTAGLFQMILFALSDIAVEISFQFRIKPVFITSGVYLAVYFIFVLKGYINIVRSSVLSMLLGTKQNEYVKQNVAILFVKAMAGTVVLGTGFYLAVRESGNGVNIMGNLFLAVVFVVIGVYLLFGGLIPFVFQGLAKNKAFLYGKERCFWVNSVVFRMKKNYRTYAMACILILCSVSALATGFAMKNRYENVKIFESVYTFQVLSSRPDLGEEVRGIIGENTEITYSAEIPIIALKEDTVAANENFGTYALVAYSDLKKLAENVGLAFDFQEPEQGQVVRASHLSLLSLITDSSHISVTIGGKVYQQTEEITVPYMGYLQDKVSFYVVNDEEFKDLVPLGQKLYTYNYRMEDLNVFETVREELRRFREDVISDYYMGIVSMDPSKDTLEWIKISYSLCIFMFMVFILASGSIMFMKLYNDSFEEKERFLVLRKIGMSHKVLQKSIAAELGAAYGLPFAVMAVSSYFSVHALELMMKADLRIINVVSVLTVSGIFLLCYILSVLTYQRNVGVSENSLL